MTVKVIPISPAYRENFDTIFRRKIDEKDEALQESCPHCGTYCTGKTAFCTPPIMECCE